MKLASTDNLTAALARRRGYGLKADTGKEIMINHVVGVHAGRKYGS